ncbi:MAG: hypothetical protein A2156_05095 [Deltaproteobacteria bacterium RBG_16_48_10]|nr:MAG: hypothetical protein A2156_05095 [Deltaproteobacteria bacterium RBG_16_48_10]
MGWIIAGVIIAFFIIAFLHEGYRVPRVEVWCQDHGFLRLNKPLSKEFETQLKRIVKMFGPLNNVWNFGLVYTGMISDLHFIVAEHDLRRPDRQRYW